MGPTRKVATQDPSTSTQSSKQKSKRHAHKPYPSSKPADNSADSLPGVQKIKSSLRQTRRLLAKPSLAADVRVATERRERALLADLARAERARVERTHASRYHKVKFFERQKIVRRIGQAKRVLAGGAGEEGEEKKGKGKSKGEKERKRQEARLAELRVDLNYILHYPKTKKYISLFPPEVRKGAAAEEAKGKGKAGKEEDTSETDKQREEVRQWIREQMDAGVLSWVPEVELRKGEAKAKRNGSSADLGAPAEDIIEAAHDRQRSRSMGKAEKKGGVADDDFFAMEDGEGSEEGSSSGSDEGEDEDSSMDDE